MEFKTVLVQLWKKKRAILEEQAEVSDSVMSLETDLVTLGVKENNLELNGSIEELNLNDFKIRAVKSKIEYNRLKLVEIEKHIDEINNIIIDLTQSYGATLNEVYEIVKGI